MKNSELPHSSRSILGMTLSELLISIAILALTLSFTSGSFTRTIEKNRIKQLEGTLINAINLAKTEAIKRSSDIVLCPSQNQINCDNDVDNWHAGWIIKAVLNEQGKPFNTNDTEAIIFSQKRATSTLTLRANTAQITFKPDGTLKQSSLFQVCNKAGKNLQQITKPINLNLAGRIRRNSVPTENLCKA